MLKNYFISLPSDRGSLEEEWKQCCDDILNNINSGYRPLKLNIFTDSQDIDSYLRCKSIIGKSVVDTFGDHCPAFSITIHPPEKPFKINVEGLYLKNEYGNVLTKYWKSIPYIVVNTEIGKEVWAAGLGDETHFDNARESGITAFKMMAGILEQENLSFNNIVRQWNYIGNILEIKDGYQNYQIFNEVRSEFYSKYRTVTGFPSATGIGMKSGGVYIDFCAIDIKKDLKIIPVNNPNQVNAYQYSQKVLKGLIWKGKSVKNTPKFERALLISNSHIKTLFVSGTASIIGQETIGKDDVAEQTLVTIENISRLTDRTYLSQLTGQELSNLKCIFIRVYVKDQKDFDKVRNICREHFPGVPSIYIEADICRDELLVEIEAEYIF